MILEVKSLSKHYDQAGTRIEALSDVSFSLEPKQNLSIVGPSGSGKTTLLTLLAGLDRPSQGDVIIDGVSLNQLSEAELTRFRGQNMGIVFQQFHLMPHLTAQENVSLPLEILGRDDVTTRSQEALSMVGLAERMNHFPHQLSGGECQRVAIARACVQRPKLLLADEPSGNLDSATGQKVISMLLNIAEETAMTLILVTHDEQIATLCSKRIHLVGGRSQ
jgi:putative ABC transport system ATP-binding protein